MHTEPSQQTQQIEYSIQLIKMTQVLEMIPVSRATLWRYIRDGKFPAPKKLGRSSFWVKEEAEQAVMNLVK